MKIYSENLEEGKTKPSFNDIHDNSIIRRFEQIKGKNPQQIYNYILVANVQKQSF